MLWSVGNTKVSVRGDAAGATVFIVAAIAVVHLVLGVLYESPTHPVTILIRPPSTAVARS